MIRFLNKIIFIIILVIILILIVILTIRGSIGVTKDVLFGVSLKDIGIIALLIIGIGVTYLIIKHIFEPQEIVKIETTVKYHEALFFRDKFVVEIICYWKKKRNPSWEIVGTHKREIKFFREEHPNLQQYLLNLTQKEIEKVTQEMRETFPKAKIIVSPPSISFVKEENINERYIEETEKDEE